MLGSRQVTSPSLHPTTFRYEGSPFVSLYRGLSLLEAERAGKFVGYDVQGYSGHQQETICVSAPHIATSLTSAWSPTVSFFQASIPDGHRDHAGGSARPRFCHCPHLVW